MSASNTDGDLTLLQLRQFGIAVDHQVLLSTFNSESIYGITVQGLVALGVLTNQDVKRQYPRKLPNSTSARYSICETLVAHLSNIGFTASGYDAIMYPSEVSTRALFDWLVASLSKTAEEAAQRSTRVEEDVAQSPSQATIAKGNIESLMGAYSATHYVAEPLRTPIMVGKVN